MTPRRNPYIAGNPVGNLASFVGRADILRETKLVLHDPNQNAITLFGQRRIGKTSILQYLTENLPKEGNFHTVFFDLEDRATKSLAQVIEELASTIARDLGWPEPSLGKNPEQTFRNSWLPEVLSKIQPEKNTDTAKGLEPRSIVLLFDEFDVLADPQAGQAAKEFFPYLRNLLSMDRKHLQFIFTLGRNLGDLNQVASSLFKGVPDKRVSLLSKEDTEALIRISERNGDLQWSNAAVEKIWLLTNGHPFLTQALCWEIWQNANESSLKSVSLVEANDIEVAINPTLEKSRNALDWLWQGLGPAEKVVASALAQAGRGIVTREDIESILNESGIVIIIRELREEAPKRLEEWDLIEPVDGGYCFRVELLRIWIADHFPLSLVQKELDAVQPVAEGLYQAARSLYQANNLEKAKPLLIQATDYNPNHRGASELLAEIYIVEKEIDKAQTLLESLFRAYPSAARPRLIQVYLKQADKTSTIDNKLLWYQKVLDISPSQSFALGAIRNIWSEKGEMALKAGDLYKALNAFEKAKNKKRGKAVYFQIMDFEIKTGLKKIEDLETDQQFKEAFQVAEELAGKYPSAHEWESLLNKLQAKEQLSELYQQALGAIAQKDYPKATQLLLAVLNIQPDYEKAAFYLSEVVAGVNTKRPLSVTPQPKINQVSSSPIPNPIRKRSQGIKRLNVWNPFDYIRFFIWVFFIPAQRIRYLDAYGENTDITHASWVASTLITLPVFYLLMGHLLGTAQGNDILSFYPSVLTWATCSSVLVWIWIGLSRKKDEDNDSFQIILLSFGFFSAMAISAENFIVTLSISVIIILTVAKGKSLITAAPGNIIYMLFVVPVFILVTWYSWDVVNSESGGMLLGSVTFVVASIIFYWIFYGIAYFLTLLVTEDVTKKELASWGSVMLICSHVFLIWVSFLGGMEILNNLFK